MGILDNIEPRKVFHFFEEICGIPHGSSNTEAISSYLASFAEERNLDYIRDDMGNVIIFKDGASQCKNAPTVILQGHMDMVCEKETDSDIDFLNDGLSLRLTRGVVSADKTTLGADDGIAVAYMLAILDASPDEITHPPIEAVFTVDEEIGMLGAAHIDCSPLKGRIMLNIDSEEEGKLLVSCAGGVTACCHMPVEYSDKSFGDAFRLSITGAAGGHSGTEIINGGANASKVLGGVLDDLSKDYNIRLVSVSGGLKDNAIPREAEAILMCSDELPFGICEKYNGILKDRYKETDKDINVSISHVDDKRELGRCMSAESTGRVIAALVNLPNGVIKMSRDISGLVQTSLNLGILKTDTESSEVLMSFSVRSSVESEKAELVKKICDTMDLFGGSVVTEGEYPAWEYRKDSMLRELMVSVYSDMYGEAPTVEAIHAGVECGLFAGKLDGLDCVSFGPQIDDIHTPKERMYVDSVERTWKYLLNILRRINDGSMGK